MMKSSSTVALAGSGDLAVVESTTTTTGMRYDAHHHQAAAISLNNTAVSLLTRGYYQEASIIFKDAIRILRSDTELGTPPPTTDDDRVIVVGKEAEDINLCLHRASQYWAQSFSSQHRAPQLVHNANSNNPYLPHLVHISSQSNPSIVHETLTSGRDIASLHVAFPITIDLIDLERTTSKDNSNNSMTMTLEASMIMYNLGISYSCVAAATASSCASVQEPSYSVQCRLHRIFHMAKVLLSKVENNNGDSTTTSTSTSTNTMWWTNNSHLLLQTALTHTLLNVAITLDLPHEYNEYIHSMQYLLQLNEMQQKLLPFVDHNIAGAA